MGTLPMRGAAAAEAAAPGSGAKHVLISPFAITGSWVKESTDPVLIKQRMADATNPLEEANTARWSDP